MGAEGTDQQCSNHVKDELTTCSKVYPLYVPCTLMSICHRCYYCVLKAVCLQDLLTTVVFSPTNAYMLGEISSVVSHVHATYHGLSEFYPEICFIMFFVTCISQCC